MRQGEHMLARPAARADVGSAPARDGEAQELAARPQRQDRRGQAQEEPARRAPAPRPGAEAHRRDDVVDVREVGVRGVRADGRAHRDRTSASSRRRSRSRRSSPATGSRRTSSSSRRAPTSGTVDNQLLALKQKMGMLPAGSADSEGARRRAAATKRPCTPRSRTSRARRRAIDVDCSARRRVAGGGHSGSGRS